MTKILKIFLFTLVNFFLFFLITAPSYANHVKCPEEDYAIECRPVCGTAGTCGKETTCTTHCGQTQAAGRCSDCPTPAPKTCKPTEALACSPRCGEPSTCGQITRCIDDCGNFFTGRCDACPAPTPPPPSCTIREGTCTACSKICGGGTKECFDTCGKTVTVSCNNQACGVTSQTQTCQGGQWVDTGSPSCVAGCTPSTPTPNCTRGRTCPSANCGVVCGNGFTECTFTEPQPCIPVPAGTEACTRNCPRPQEQTCVAGACVNNYTIAGNVFVDLNGNTLKDAGESNYTGSIDIRSTGGTVSTGGGTYTVTATAGSYTVSYNNLPTGYRMTYPLNGPPPFFSVSIGPSCSSGGSNSASCTGGSIINLNFGITNVRPWIQCKGADCRIDAGYTSEVPSTAIGGAYANLNGSGGTPGLIFTGNSTPNFGQGQASTTNWVVGGPTYGELYTPTRVGGIVKTSYNFLLAKASAGNITPTDLSPYCTGGIANCTLQALPHGIYRANGSLTLNTFTFPASQNYVILVNGDLAIRGRITVPAGSTALFSSSGNITVERTVGEAASSTSPTIEGIYSAGRNFIVQGVGGCTAGSDLRFNVAGSVITNASLSGGSFQNQRDLCANDASYPTIYFSERLDFVLNTPDFLKQPNFTYQEIAP